MKGLITGLISRLQEKILQFIGKAVDTPVLAQRQIHMNRNVHDTMEIQQLQHTDQVVDVAFVLVARVSQVRIVAKTVEILQLPLVEKIGVILEIRTVQGHSDVSEFEHCMCPPGDTGGNWSFVNVGVRSICQHEAHHTAAA